MAQQRAAQIYAPLDMQGRMRFDLLRKQFRKYNLFGEIFRADDNLLLSAFSAACGRQRE